MEAEFIVCSITVQEAVWLRRILQSFGIAKVVFKPATIYNDSQVAFAYVKDSKYHGKTKHIDTKNNFIRDIIEQNEVILKYLPTCEMAADPFTKSISRDMFSVHVKSLGLCRL